MEAAGPLIVFVLTLAVVALMVWLPFRYFGRWYRRRREAYYREHPELYPDN